MPGQPSIEERVASLDTWRDEHKCQHLREEGKKEGSLNRKFIIIAAVIGVIGMVISGILGVVAGYLLSTIPK